MNRALLGLLLGLALIVVSVAPVAAAQSVPGWTIWTGDANGYNVEWSATEYTHAYAGSIDFDLRNNISEGMSMGLSNANNYFYQVSKVGGTAWAAGVLNDQSFITRAYPYNTNFPAMRFAIGVKTGGYCQPWDNPCDLSWSGYLNY
jgi:hypothetical protein